MLNFDVILACVLELKGVGFNVLIVQIDLPDFVDLELDGLLGVGFLVVHLLPVDGSLHYFGGLGLGEDTLGGGGWFEGYNVVGKREGRFVLRELGLGLRLLEF